MPTKFLCLIGILATFGLSVSCAIAQEATTGTIEGVVSDPQGGPLPGATVSLVTAQGVKTATTDTDGRFRFSFLPAGDYELTAALQGFSTVSRQNITVTLGARVRLEVMLTPGVSETMEVTAAAPVIDLSTATSGATINSDMMRSVPVGRTFASTVALAPGVVASGIDDANPSIAGASGLENTYVVDGVNIGNTGYGSSGSYSVSYGSLGTGVNFDYIQEVQVKTGGYEPEYGEALGGFINLVTRTGGNDFRGSIFTYQQTAGLEATRVVSDRQEATYDPISYSSSDFGFDVGGPIAKDKAFFYAAFDPTYTTYTRRTSRAIADAQGFSHELLLERNVYNYAANIRWFVSPKHTLSISTFGDPSVGPVGPQRESSLALMNPTDRYSEIKYGGNNVVGRWTGELASNWFAEGSVAFHHDRFEETPANNLSYGINRLPEVPVRYGSVGFFEKSESNNLQYQLKLSNYFDAYGEHQLRYGVEYQDIGYDHTANYSGTPGLELPDGTISTTGFTWEIINDPDLGGDLFHINRIRSGQITAKTKAHYLAFFVSDRYKISDWLSVMAGVRWEQEKLIGNLSEFTWSANWGPRFNVTVDPLRDNKSKLSFAFGRFFGKVPNDLAVRALSSEVTYNIYYPLANVDMTDPNHPVILDPTDYVDYYTFGNEPTVIDRKSKLTYQDEYVVTAEREVSKDLKVGVSYMHRSLGRTLEDVALVPYSEILNGTADFGNYYITNPTPELGFPKPSRKYDAVTLRFEKPLAEGWQAMASYTLSWLKGNYEGYYRRDNGQSDPFITSLFDFPYLADPQIFAGTIEDGYLPNDRRHVVNMFGSYRFNFGLNAGLSVQVQSGTPITKLGYNDVYGNEGEIVIGHRGDGGRGPTTTDVGVHLSYPFGLGGKSQNVEVIVDVFNLFDQQKGTDFDQNYELGGSLNMGGYVNPDFGKPTLYQPPRQIRFAARTHF